MNCDFFGFLEDTKDVYLYTANSPTDIQMPRIFEKTKGGSFIFFVVVGGAGGGGGSTVTTGGGGGAGGAVVSAIVPWIHCPDRLYVKVGLGTVGGAGSSNANPGQASTILLNPYATNDPAPNTFLRAGGGGGGTSGNNGGAGGLTGAGGDVSVSPISFLSLVLSGNTAAGFQGNSTAIGNSINLWGGVTGGCGGGGAAGGVQYAGGSFTPDVVPLQPVAGGTAGGGNGGQGYSFLQPNPFFGIGGGGGGGNLTGAGGRGGDGGLGCGGGGAGGSATGAAGTGGTGGNGYVIIGII